MVTTIHATGMEKTIILHVQVLLIALVSGFLNGSRPLELIRRHGHILIHAVKFVFFQFLFRQ